MQNVQVQLQFTANTDQARQQIQSLQQSLKSLSAMPSGTSPDFTGFNQKVMTAKQSVMQLGAALENSLNPKTGQLNLTKFSNELAKTGMGIKDYATQLNNLGPQGRQAFTQLTQSVVSARTQFTMTNKVVTALWANLKNVAKWQISSFVLRGITSAFRDAFSYAKDLNESLNSIRIVTGQSVEQMADFAKHCSKAAKELSTTTVAYSDASLIFYQQGLTGKDVTDRADVTVKMANVTGQAVEEVSNQLTAVWNNFYNGSEALETYADKMVALGAATASSSTEIATGLEKFAAIAETTGLSFDYAAAALATVTATTRQSADVVGTAFKTMFARIQDLELGETLDDGTTLGKYSEALYKVGVDIQDGVNGVKDMNVILEETAAKWETLNNDEKIALAQTVAGIRQYSQFMALMDNWDFMEQNLGTVEASTGALQEQQEIYEEGWVGTSKRVKAAWEGIYDSLISDEFIINLIDGFSKFLNLLEKIIDSMGGFRGLMAGISALIFKIAGPQITNGFANMAMSLHSMTKSGQMEMKALKEETIRLNAEMMKASTSNPAQLQKNQALMDQINLEEQVRNKHKNLTQEQEAQLNIQKEIIAMHGENLAALAEEKQREADVLAELEAQVEALRKKKENAQTQGSATLNKVLATGGVNNTGTLGYNDIKKSSWNESEDHYAKRLAPSLNISEDAARKLYQALGNLSAQEQKTLKDSGNLEKITNKLTEAEKKAADQANKCTEANQRFTEGEKNKADVINKAGDAVVGATTKYQRFAQTLTSTFSGISSLTMGISSLSSAWKTIQDPDMSGWDKFLSISMSLSMGLPMLFTGITKLNAALKTSALYTSLNASARLGENKALLMSLGGHRANYAIKTRMNREDAIEYITRGLNITSKEAEIILDNTRFKLAIKNMFAKKKENDLTLKQIILEKFRNATMLKTYLIIGLVIGAIWLLIKGIQGLINWYNKDKIALENSQKQYENQKKVLDETKKSYDELKSSIENYHKAQDAINSMTQNTEEWKKAIEEANWQVIELLNNYPMLSDYITNTNGRLEISQAGFKALNEEVEALIDQQQYLVNSRSIDVNEKKIELNKTELSRDIDISKDVLNKLEQIYGSIGAQMFVDYEKYAKQISDGNDKLANELIENKSKITELIQTNNNLEKTNNLIYSEMAKEVFGDDTEGTPEQRGYMQSSEGQQRATLYANQQLKQLTAEQRNQKILELNFGEEQAKNYRIKKGKLEKRVNGGWEDQGIVYDDDAVNEGLTDYYIKEYASNNALDFQKQGANIIQNTFEQYGIKLTDEEKEQYLASDGTNLDLSGFSKEEIENLKNNFKNSLYYDEATIAEMAKKDAYWGTWWGASDETLNTAYTNGQLNKYKEKAIEKLYGPLLTAIENYDPLDASAVLGDVSGFDTLSSTTQEEALNYYNDLTKEEKKIFKEKIDFMTDKNQEGWEKIVEEQKLASEASKKIEHFKNLDTIEKNLDSFNEAITELSDNGYISGETFSQLEELFGSLGNEWNEFVNVLSNTNSTFSEQQEAINNLINKYLEESTALGQLTPQLQAETVMRLKNMGITNAQEIVNEKLAENLAALSIEYGNNTEALEKEAAALGYSTEQISEVVAVQQALKDSTGAALAQLVTEGTVSEKTAAQVLKLKIAQIDFNSTAAATDLSNLISQYAQLYGTVAAASSAIANFGKIDSADGETGVFKKEIIGYSTNMSELNKLLSSSGLSIGDFDSNWFTWNNGAATGVVSGYNTKLRAAVIEKLGTKATEDMLGQINTVLDTTKVSYTPSGGKNGSGSDKDSDPYLDENNALERNNREIEKNNELIEKSIGLKKIQAIENKKRLNEEREQLYQKLKKEADNQIKANKDFLEENGAEFDEITGEILNQEELLAKIGSDNKQYDAYIEAIEVLQEVEDGLYEVAASKSEAILERAKLMFESIRENTENEIEYWNSIMELLDEDELDSISEKLSGTSKQIDFYKISVRAVNDEIAELQAQQVNLDPTEFATRMKELGEKAFEYAEALKSIKEEQEGAYGEALDLVSEKLGEITEKYDNLNTALDHYMELTELINGEKDFAGIGNILSSQNEVLRQQKDSALQEYQMYSNEMQVLQKALRKADSDAEKAALERQIKDLEPVLAESYDKYLGLAEEYANNLKDIYSNTIEQIKYDLEKILTNDKGYDLLDQIVEGKQFHDDSYLTETNKLYESNKLIRQAQQEIDKSTNKLHQQMLKTFQQETDLLSKQKNLSKEEFEIQKLKYDLLVAQIALEDAREAKNKVRLIRDSQGNFTYAYTADQNTIDEAQSAVNDAENALYNKQVERANNAASGILDTYKEYTDSLGDLDPTDPQYEQKAEQLFNNMMEKIRYYYGEYDSAAAGLGNSIEETWAFTVMQSLGSISEFEEKGKQAKDNAIEAMGTFQEASKELAEEIEIDGSNMEKALDGIEKKAQTTSETFTQAVDDMSTTLQNTGNDMITWMETNLEAIDLMIERLKGYAGAAYNTGLVQGNWKDALGNSENQGQQAYALGNWATQMVAEGKIADTDTAKEAGLLYEKVLKSGHNSLTEKEKNQLLAAFGLRDIDYGNLMRGAETLDKLNEYAAKRELKIEVLNMSAAEVGKSTKEILDECMKKFTIPTVGSWLGTSQFASGGYTGEWGSDGRLAMLHQKELVLNAHDTENMLQTVDLVRKIVEATDPKRFMTSHTLDSILASARAATVKDAIEQNVTITAEFPNATDRNEIKAAFDDIINEATQYAGIRRD